MKRRTICSCILSLVMTIARTQATAPASGDWSHRVPIVFSGYDRPGALTNFPALVVFEEGMGGFSYRQAASPAGADLRFMDAGQTVWLAHEIERWDTNGTSCVWVNVPELAGTNTLIWALWGNTNALEAPAYTTNGGTWAAVYGGVWHLAQTNAPDSSGNGNGFTAYDGPADTPGPVGRGLYFNGSNRLQAAGAPYEYAGPTTVEFWMRSDDASYNRAALGMRDSATRWSLHQTVDLAGLGLWNNYAYLTLAYAGGLATGQWYHVVFMDSGVDTFGATDVYVDGALAGTLPGSFGKLTGRPLVAGTAGTGYGIESWIGGLDEIRIAPQRFSADRVWATWMNQASNAAFVTWQTNGLALSNSRARNVTTASADLTGLLLATSAAPTEVWVYWGTNDAGNVKGDWDHAVATGPQEPGLLSVGVTLTNETTYYYRFYASNALDEVWAEPASFFISGAVTVEATKRDAVEDGLVAGEFTVSRPAACAREALTVRYTLGGTANNGADYDALPGYVVMGAGETKAIITVTPIADSLTLEAPETVRIALTAGPHAVGVPDSAVVTIYNRLGEDLPGDWAHRMRLDITGYAGATRLTNFPALVVLNEATMGFRYGQCASATGGDLRFLDAAQARWLTYEIDGWAPGTNSHVWVQIPELAGTNTSVWALWGNPNATNPPAYATNGLAWAPVYGGVWHMTQTNALDSTTNFNHTTAKGYYGSTPLPALVGAPAGQGLVFNGTNRLETAANRPSLEFDNGSLEFWMRPDTLSETDNRGPIGMHNLTFGTRWSVFVYKGLTRIGLFNGTGGPAYLLYPFAQDAWYHVTIVETNGIASTYINGAYLGAASRGFSSVKGVPLLIGAGNQGLGEYFIGAMDEVRLSPVAFSADWIRASWLTQVSNSVFLTAVRMIANEEASNVTAGSATLNGRLNWDNGVPIEVWVYWGAADGGMDKTNWEHAVALGPQTAGPLSAGVTFTNETTYYYRFYASNAVEEGWATPAAILVPGAVTLDADTPARFTVRRPAGLTRGALTVNYAVGGTARSGVDYRALPGHVTLAAGETEAVIPVVMMSDSLALVPGPRTVAATLAPGPYIVGSPDSGMFTIENHPRGWSQRMEITFSGYTGTETLTNFPALVVFREGRPEAFRYGTFTFPSACDLRFSDGLQTRWLAYEVDEWNPSGESRVWVQLPALAGTNTAIWACWGNPFASAVPAYTTNGMTWSANYQAVLHFAENNGTTSKDSSPNQFTGSLVGAPGPYWEEGKIGTALHYDGLDDRFDTGKNASNFGMDGNKPKTSEAWVKVDGALADNGAVFSMGNASTGNEWTLNRLGPSLGWASQHWDAEVVVNDAGHPDPIANWVHVAHTYDPAGGLGNSVKFYINGVQAGIGGPASLNVNTLNPVVLGCWYTRSWLRTYYDGYIDEARLANVTRSADWIKADWMSQGSPETFATYEVFVPIKGTLLIVR